MNGSTEPRKRFFACDFHVHTPASDCFQGPRDNWCIKMLLQCKQNGVEMIAITDHNSIDGYAEFTKKKNDLLSFHQRLIQEIDNHPECRRLLKKCEEEIALFDRCQVLPGIEYEAKPGVHLLFVFPPTLTTDQLFDFLKRGGYPNEHQGVEDPPLRGAWEVLDAIDQAAELGGICIAAHADSNKGIYNTVRSGAYRADIFKSEHLFAIAFNSINTAKKMMSLLEQPQYKRQSPLAFIQCSDYHGREDQEVGKPLVYLRLSHPSFDNIKNALRNPDEDVSITPKPETLGLIKRLLERPTTHVFQDVESNESKRAIQELTCALSNNGPGTIIIGVSADLHKTIIGTSMDCDSVGKLINDLRTEISPQPIMNVRSYQYANRNIHTIRVERGNLPIHTVEATQSCYIIQNNKPVQALPANLVKISESRWMSEFREVSDALGRRRQRIIAQLQALDDENEEIETVLRLRRASIPLRAVASCRFLLPTRNVRVNDFERILAGASHGTPEGDTAVLSPEAPRLPYAYLRYTVPKSVESGSLIGQVLDMTPSTVFVCPGGASYISDLGLTDPYGVIVLHSEMPSLALTILPEYADQLSAKLLLAYLKSSICLWYMLTLYASTDIYHVALSGNLPVPMYVLDEHAYAITNLVDQIIELEKGFLEIEVSRSSVAPALDVTCTHERDEVSSQERSRLVEEHNNMVSGAVSQIDDILFEALDVTEPCRTAISRSIRQAGLFTHSPKEDESGNASIGRLKALTR